MPTFSKKPVQLVRHLDDVVAKFKTEWAKDGGYVQVKYDGVYAFAVFNIPEQAWGLYSRTGLRHTNVEQIEQELPKCSPDEVYIMELLDPSLSLEGLSGAISSQRVKPLAHKLDLVARVHDAIPIADFMAGYSAVPYSTRLRRVLDMTTTTGGRLQPVNSKRTRCTVDEVYKQADGVIAWGHEGIVAKLPEADWKAGRKTYHAVKVVCGVSYDLRCIRVEEGKGKRAGMVANAIVSWRMYGESTGPVVELPVDLGRGFDDQRRIELFKDPNQIVGHIVKVDALQIGSRGSLRLPKVSEIRIDKDEADL